MKLPLFRACAVSAFAVLAGCSSAPTRYDPLEPVNRAVFKFNEKADQYFLKPVAKTYVTVVPGIIRLGVANFFGNVDDLLCGFNRLLQGKRERAGTDFGRVLINTSFGLGGLIDVASEGALENDETDLGITLGVWGLRPGPFLMLPILGPSSIRDGSGTFVQGYADPITNIRDVGWRNSLYGLRIVDTRAQMLGNENLLSQAALDKYVFLRRAYLQHRQSMVYDGKPPPEEDDDQ